MHPVELKVSLFLQNALAGSTTITEEVADKVASDVKSAMFKQFSGGPRDKFRLRMSNIGKPKCQLWFQKNDPDAKAPYPPSFLINMITGDIIEAVFKGLLRSADVEFNDNDNVELDLGDLGIIKGEYDMILNGSVDDVKSASDVSYNGRFESFDKLEKSDDFGYIPQLVGYAIAAGKDVGGFWVVNKKDGAFKYVSVSSANKEVILQDIKEKVAYINNDEPFERCFTSVPEYYRKKASGNLKLGKSCGWCNFKTKCWPQLKRIPSRVSQAKDKPLVDYILINDGK